MHNSCSGRYSDFLMYDTPFREDSWCWAVRFFEYRWIHMGYEVGVALSEGRMRVVNAPRSAAALGRQQLCEWWGQTCSAFLHSLSTIRDALLAQQRRRLEVDLSGISKATMWSFNLGAQLPNDVRFTCASRVAGWIDLVLQLPSL
jgi:hypothetical protein